MHKIVFQNPDGQPKPTVAQTYSSIISASISEIKCKSHNQAVDFRLIFEAPNIYFIEITACCNEFKTDISEKVGRMLS